MQVPVETEMDAFDTARIESVLATLGHQRYNKFLGILGARLQDLADAAATPAADMKSLIPALHQSRGSAASLGLAGLASAMCEVEALITADALYVANAMAVGAAARALVGTWRASALNLSLQYAGVLPDHASGSSSI